MKRIQTLHRAIAAGNIGAVLTGLGLGGLHGITLNMVLFFCFLILLRIKFWFDDEQYFTDVDSGKLPSGIPFCFGVTVAVISWILWYLAALFIKDIERAGQLMAIVMFLSTVWIVATLVRRGAYSEQVPWLFFNSFYILGFLLLFLRRQRWNPFRDHCDGFTTCVIAELLVVFLFDLVGTRILEQRRVQAGARVPSEP